MIESITYVDFPIGRRNDVMIKYAEFLYFLVGVFLQNVEQVHAQQTVQVTMTLTGFSISLGFLA